MPKVPYLKGRRSAGEDIPYPEVRNKYGKANLALLGRLQTIVGMFPHHPKSYLGSADCAEGACGSQGHVCAGARADEQVPAPSAGV